jgi:hypothetical protein
MTLPVTFANLPGPIPLAYLDENFSALTGTSGASNVGYSGPTGATAGTVAAKLAQFISVTDPQFGADPTGTTSSVAAIQAAINFVAPTGGTIFFPSGTYKIDSTLNWTNASNNSMPPIYFVGTGSGVPGRYSGGTTLKSYVASGPVLNVQGTLITTGGTGNTFAMGGGIQGIVFDGTNASGTSQALKILGWWNFDIQNVLIQNFPGDGVTFYSSSGPSGIWGTDGDYTASALGVIEKSWIYNCAGTGINTQGASGFFNGTTGLRFKSTEVQYCGTGAVITGSGTLLEDVSFSGTGFVPSSSSTRGTGMSVIVGALSGGKPFGVWFQDCEWDFALTAHVSLVNCENVWFDAANQIIFRDLNGAGSTTGTMTPPIGIGLAIDSASETVFGVYAKSINVRANTPRTVTAFQLGYASNVQNVSIEDPVFSDGNNTGSLTLTAAPTAATSATLSASFTGTTGTYLLTFSQGSYRVGTLTNGSTAVTWTGAVTDVGASVTGTSNMTMFGGAFLSSYNTLVNDYHLSAGGVSNTSLPQSSPSPFAPGRQPPFYIGTSLAATSLTGGTFITIPFDTQDSTAAQIYPSYGANGQASNINFYSTATHQFTAPVSAFHEVSGALQVASATSADTFRVIIYYNGTTLEAANQLGSAPSTGVCTVPIPPTVLYCGAGTAIYIQCESVVNTRALSTSVPSRLVIRMVGDVH